MQPSAEQLALGHVNQLKAAWTADREQLGKVMDLNMSQRSEIQDLRNSLSVVQDDLMKERMKRDLVKSVITSQSTKKPFLGSQVALMNILSLFSSSVKSNIALVALIKSGRYWSLINSQNDIMITVADSMLDDSSKFAQEYCWLATESILTVNTMEVMLSSIFGRYSLLDHLKSVSFVFNSHFVLTCVTGLQPSVGFVSDDTLGRFVNEFDTFSDVITSVVEVLLLSHINFLELHALEANHKSELLRSKLSQFTTTLQFIDYFGTLLSDSDNADLGCPSGELFVTDLISREHRGSYFILSSSGTCVMMNHGREDNTPIDKLSLLTWSYVHREPIFCRDVGNSMRHTIWDCGGDKSCSSIAVIPIFYSDGIACNLVLRWKNQVPSESTYLLACSIIDRTTLDLSVLCQRLSFVEIERDPFSYKDWFASLNLQKDFVSMLDSNNEKSFTSNELTHLSYLHRLCQAHWSFSLFSWTSSSSKGKNYVLFNGEQSRLFSESELQGKMNALLLSDIESLGNTTDILLSSEDCQLGWKVIDDVDLKTTGIFSMLSPSRYSLDTLSKLPSVYHSVGYLRIKCQSVIGEVECHLFLGKCFFEFEVLSIRQSLQYIPWTFTSAWKSSLLENFDALQTRFATFERLNIAHDRNQQDITLWEELLSGVTSAVKLNKRLTLFSILNLPIDSSLTFSLLRNALYLRLTSILENMIRNMLVLCNQWRDSLSEKVHVVLMLDEHYSKYEWSKTWQYSNSMGTWQESRSDLSMGSSTSSSTSSHSFFVPLYESTPLWHTSHSRLYFYVESSEYDLRNVIPPLSLVALKSSFSSFLQEHFHWFLASFPMSSMMALPSSPSGTGSQHNKVIHATSDSLSSTPMNPLISWSSSPSRRSSDSPLVSSPSLGLRTGGNKNLSNGMVPSYSMSSSSFLDEESGSLNLNHCLNDILFACINRLTSWLPSSSWTTNLWALFIQETVSKFGNYWQSYPLFHRNGHFGLWGNNEDVHSELNTPDNNKSWKTFPTRLGHHLFQEIMDSSSPIVDLSNYQSSILDFLVDEGLLSTMSTMKESSWIVVGLNGLRSPNETEDYSALWLIEQPFFPMISIFHHLTRRIPSIFNTWFNFQETYLDSILPSLCAQNSSSQTIVAANSMTKSRLDLVFDRHPDYYGAKRMQWSQRMASFLSLWQHRSYGALEILGTAILVRLPSWTSNSSKLMKKMQFREWDIFVSDFLNENYFESKKHDWDMEIEESISSMKDISFNISHNSCRIFYDWFSLEDKRNPVDLQECIHKFGDPRSLVGVRWLISLQVATIEVPITLMVFSIVGRNVVMSSSNTFVSSMKTSPTIRSKSRSKNDDTLNNMEGNSSSWHPLDPSSGIEIDCFEFFMKKNSDMMHSWILWLSKWCDEFTPEVNCLSQLTNQINQTEQEGQELCNAGSDLLETHIETLACLRLDTDSILQRNKKDDNLFVGMNLMIHSNIKDTMRSILSARSSWKLLLDDFQALRASHIELQAQLNKSRDYAGSLLVGLDAIGEFQEALFDSCPENIPDISSISSDLNLKRILLISFLNSRLLSSFLKQLPSCFFRSHMTYEMECWFNHLSGIWKKGLGDTLPQFCNKLSQLLTWKHEASDSLIDRNERKANDYHHSDSLHFFWVDQKSSIEDHDFGFSRAQSIEMLIKSLLSGKEITWNANNNQVSYWKAGNVMMEFAKTSTASFQPSDMVVRNHFLRLFDPHSSSLWHGSVSFGGEDELLASLTQSLFSWLPDNCAQTFPFELILKTKVIPVLQRLLSVNLQCLACFFLSVSSDHADEDPMFRGEFSSGTPLLLYNNQSCRLRSTRTSIPSSSTTLSRKMEDTLTEVLFKESVLRSSCGYHDSHSLLQQLGVGQWPLGCTTNSWLQKIEENVGKQCLFHIKGYLLIESPCSMSFQDEVNVKHCLTLMKTVVDHWYQEWLLSRQDESLTSVLQSNQLLERKNDSWKKEIDWMKELVTCYGRINSREPSTSSSLENGKRINSKREIALSFLSKAIISSNCCHMELSETLQKLLSFSCGISEESYVVCLPQAEMNNNDNHAWLANSTSLEIDSSRRFQGLSSLLNGIAFYQSSIVDDWKKYFLAASYWKKILLVENTNHAVVPSSGLFSCVGLACIPILFSSKNAVSLSEQYGAFLLFNSQSAWSNWKEAILAMEDSASHENMWTTTSIGSNSSFRLFSRLFGQFEEYLHLVLTVSNIDNNLRLTNYLWGMEEEISKRLLQSKQTLDIESSFSSMKDPNAMLAHELERILSFTCDWNKENLVASCHFTAKLHWAGKYHDEFGWVTLDPERFMSHYSSTALGYSPGDNYNDNNNSSSNRDGGSQGISRTIMRSSISPDIIHQIALSSHSYCIDGHLFLGIMLDRDNSISSSLPSSKTLTSRLSSPAQESQIATVILELGLESPDMEYLGLSSQTSMWSGLRDIQSFSSFLDSLSSMCHGYLTEFYKDSSLFIINQAWSILQSRQHQQLSTLESCAVELTSEGRKASKFTRRMQKYLLELTGVVGVNVSYLRNDIPIDQQTSERPKEFEYPSNYVPAGYFPVFGETLWASKDSDSPPSNFLSRRGATSYDSPAYSSSNYPSSSLSLSHNKRLEDARFSPSKSLQDLRRVEYQFDCFETQGVVILYFPSESTSLDLCGVRQLTSLLETMPGWSSKDGLLTRVSEWCERLCDTDQSLTQALVRAMARRLHELHRGSIHKRTILSQEDEVQKNKRLLSEYVVKIADLESARALALSEMESLSAENDRLRAQLRSEHGVTQEAMAQHKSLSEHVQRVLAESRREVAKKDTMIRKLLAESKEQNRASLQSAQSQSKDVEKFKIEAEKALAKLKKTEESKNAIMQDLSQLEFQLKNKTHQYDETIAQLKKDLSRLEKELKLSREREELSVGHSDSRLRQLLNQLQTSNEELDMNRNSVVLLRQQLDSMTKGYSLLEDKLAQITEHNSREVSLLESRLEDYRQRVSNLEKDVLKWRVAVEDEKEKCAQWQIKWKSLDAERKLLVDGWEDINEKFLR